MYVCFREIFLILTYKIILISVLSLYLIQQLFTNDITQQTMIKSFYIFNNLRDKNNFY